ncbi:MAG: homoserine kinase [Bdellovibrionales bacterium]|nr:homoserine kinase [Bdellovibrionales bacterium]
MSSPNAVKVFGPATVANVSCGFDILGFALNEPGDLVIAQKTDKRGLTFECPQAESLGISVELEKNTATAPVISLMKALNPSKGVHLMLDKLMPVGSGLGSSAASAAAALVAVNSLFDSPLSREELVTFGVEAERVACGTGHADNIGPAIMGGFVLIRSTQPLDLVALPAPDKLHCTIVHPAITLETRDSRDVLKQNIQLKKAVTQWGNTAALVAALYRDDLELLGRSLQDVVVEPERSQILPGFAQAKSAAMDSGALGFGISGSGPSLFALSDSDSKAKAIASALRSVFDNLRLGCETYCSKINTLGARVIEEER